MISSITNYQNTGDWFYIFTAVLVIDLIGLFLDKYPGNSPFFKINTLDKWYTKFGILAILSDVTSILIGIGITRYLYTYFNFTNPIFFLLLLLIVQICHDAFFYLAVIRPMPVGHNQMIDVFKEYATENGAKVLGSDALIMFSSVGLAALLKNQPAHITSSVAILTVYALCYIVYTRKAITKD